MNYQNINLLYFFPCNFTFDLDDDCDILKLIKSIKTLSKKYSFIVLKQNCNKSIFEHATFDSNIYFYVENPNKLFVSFCHMYYDGYSIFYIIEQIDLIYKTMDTHTHTHAQTHNKKINTIQIPKLILNKHIDYISGFFNMMNSVDGLNTNILNMLSNKKLFIIKIKKINLESNIDIIVYILKKLRIDKFSLLVNLRKLNSHTNNSGLMGNLIYYINDLGPNINSKKIRKILHNQQKLSYDVLAKNVIPNNLSVNSYLSFNIPSFVKMFELEKYRGNGIIIYPKNIDKTHWIVHWYK